MPQLPENISILTKPQSMARVCQVTPPNLAVFSTSWISTKLDSGIPCHTYLEVLPKICFFKFEYDEKELAQKVKSLGGKWNQEKKAWKLPFEHVQILQLEERILK